MKNWGTVFTFAVAALLAGAGMFISLKTQSLQAVVCGGLLSGAASYIGWRYMQGKRS